MRRAAIPSLDPVDYWREFDYDQLDHVQACVPYDLAEAIQAVLACKSCAAESYEDARNLLEKAIKQRWEEL